MKKITLLLIITVHINSVTSQEKRAFVRSDNLWGVINQKNEFIIDSTFNGMYSTVFNYLPPPERWRLIYSPADNVFKFREKNNFGFIDAKGEITIPAIFDKASDFNDGYAVVKKSIKYGVIDKQGGFLFEPVKSKIIDFTEGMVLIQATNFKFGFLNSDGEEITKTVFKEALPFSEGLACVKFKGKWGFIDSDGNWVVEPQFKEAKSFDAGLALVCPGKWGAIDHTGNFIIESEYNKIQNQTEGVYRVKLNRLWGFVDTAGETVSDYLFDDVGQFSEGLAAVSVKGKEKRYVGILYSRRAKTNGLYIREG